MQKTIINKLILCFLGIILLGFSLVSCYYKVADYPKNVKLANLSKNSNYYIFYWDKDPDASEYTIYYGTSSNLEKNVTSNNYLISHIYYNDDVSFGVSMTIDGDESYVSDFLDIEDAASPFTSIKLQKNNNSNSLTWDSFPGATSYYIVESSYKNAFSNTATSFSNYYYDNAILCKTSNCSDCEINSSKYYAVYANVEGTWYLITNPVLGENLIETTSN